MYKKGDHQCVENYRLVSLLEILIYSAMFKNFLDNNLISSNQSGLKPGTPALTSLLQ